jgi:hypothetical protein
MIRNILILFEFLILLIENLKVKIKIKMELSQLAEASKFQGVTEGYIINKNHKFHHKNNRID